MLPSMLAISNSGVYLWSITKGQQQTKNIIYHNVRFLYYITIATKSKRNQNFVHAKCHTTVKYQISFNQLAVTVHKKVTLADKKRNHTNKFNSPLTESLMWQSSHLVPSQVHELRYALGFNLNKPLFQLPTSENIVLGHLSGPRDSVPACSLSCLFILLITRLSSLRTLTLAKKLLANNKITRTQLSSVKIFFKCDFRMTLN